MKSNCLESYIWNQMCGWILYGVLNLLKWTPQDLFTRVVVPRQVLQNIVLEG